MLVFISFICATGVSTNICPSNPLYYPNQISDIQQFIEIDVVYDANFYLKKSYGKGKEIKKTPEKTSVNSKLQKTQNLEKIEKKQCIYPKIEMKDCFETYEFFKNLDLKKLLNGIDTDDYSKKFFEYPYIVNPPLTIMTNTELKNESNNDKLTLAKKHLCQMLTHLKVKYVSELDTKGFIPNKVNILTLIEIYEVKEQKDLEILLTKSVFNENFTFTEDICKIFCNYFKKSNILYEENLKESRSKK
ncbi:hypothetical protein GVAV_002696 [Gurleya vavrai]